MLRSFVTSANVVECVYILFLLLTNDRYAVSVVCRVFLNCSAHFFDVVVRISRVGEVHTHQFDALVVYHDRCIDDPFVDLLGVDDFLSPLLVQHDANSVFVVVLSCFHECVSGVSPKFLSLLASTFRSSIFGWKIVLSFRTAVGIREKKFF